MNRKIKVLWDFRGPDALKIAEHHRIHLQEYADQQQLVLIEIGVQVHTDYFASAFMTIDESDLLSVRDQLKPQRAVLAN